MKDWYFSSTGLVHKLSIISQRLITAIRGNAWKFFLTCYLLILLLWHHTQSVSLNDFIKREIYKVWGSYIKKDWVSYIMFNNHILNKEIECSKRSIMDVKKGFTNHAKYSKTSKRKNKTFYACAKMNTLWSLSMTWVFDLNYYWKYTSKIFMAY